MRVSWKPSVKVATGFAVFALTIVAVQAQAPGSAFKDCSDCPEMVVVPAGSFMMGNGAPGAPSYETPQHRVTIAAGFAIGKYEVTQTEWMTVMGNNPSSYVGPTRPVEGMSWIEAQEYARRLA